MIALLLAQLVMPSPSVEPLPPSGMVCMGECSDGPMVWRASPARVRLVVECDMRSDTCSDGRKITTVRASPVPCETSPGVWEMVPEDEGCYGVRGLESWAATTSYLSYGADLGRSPWGGAATVTLDGSTYRVCAESGGAFLQQLRAEDGGVVRTAACRVRAGTSNSIRLLSADVSSGGVSFDYELTDEWQTVTATATVVEGGGIAGVRLHPARSGAGCVEVAGCWSVIGDTPGRPCWGGEAPVTCAADRHTISTEGRPSESGDISIAFETHTASTAQMILDTRDGDTKGLALFVDASGAVRAGIPTGESQVFPFLSEPGAVSLGMQYVGRLVVHGVVHGEKYTLFLNGAKVGEVTSEPILGHSPTATLGMNQHGANHLNGSISSIRLRSFE